MTVRQLRELKKEVPTEPAAQAAGQTSDQTTGLKEPTLEEIKAENTRLADLYCTEANLVDINGETTQITHYIMQELCRLAGIKYIDWEDYEITVKFKDEAEAPQKTPVVYSQGKTIRLKESTIKDICNATGLCYNPKHAFNINAYWG